MFINSTNIFVRIYICENIGGDENFVDPRNFKPSGDYYGNIFIISFIPKPEGEKYLRTTFGTYVKSSHPFLNSVTKTHVVSEAHS